MKKINREGMSLVELLIVMVITSAVVLSFGSLLTTSFSSWSDEFALIGVESELRFFRRAFEVEFRNATAEPADILTTTTSNDTIHFTSYYNNYNLANQYTQHEYKLTGTNLVHNSWNSQYAGGVLIPASPWSTTPSRTEVVSESVSGISYRWDDCEPLNSTSCVIVTISQRKTLPSGKVYNSDSYFFVYSINRGRGKRSYEYTK